MNNSKITKTADLSEFTDEQIKIMFQAADVFSTLKDIVTYLKTEKYENPFDRAEPKPLVLRYIKEACAKNKIDPNLLGL